MPIFLKASNSVIIDLMLILKLYVLLHIRVLQFTKFQLNLMKNVEDTWKQIQVVQFIKGQ